MKHRIETGVTRRWQTDRAVQRRIARAYGAMGRFGDRAEARWSGGWHNILATPGRERMLRAEAHGALCHDIAAGLYAPPIPYTAEAYSLAAREVEFA